MLIASMTLVGLYVAVRLVWPLPLGWPVRLLLGAAALLCANKIVVLRWFVPGGGTLAGASFELLVAAAWLHAFVLLMALIGLALDIPGIILHVFGIRLFTPVARCAVVGLCAAVLAAVGVRNAVGEPEVREISVPVRHLPAELAGLRIVLLADLHIGPVFGRDWVEKVVALTNATKPDLIAIAGDVVDDTPARLARSTEPLTRLQARHGVYVIVGNHEYYAGLDAWLKAFPGLGMRLLYNSHDCLRIGGAGLVIAGLSDRVTLNRPLYGERPDIEKALRGAPPGDDMTVRILLDHQPAGAGDNAGHDLDMQLSGHTHGGLVLFLQKFVALANGGFVSGLYDVNGMTLLVSNGTGLWGGMPLRLGVPGQILVLNMMRRPDG
jgi:predicted MPP superfamily phosphohydrolase